MANNSNLIRSKTGAVISTDLSGYDLIKRDRVRRKAEQAMQNEMDAMKKTMAAMMKKIEELTGG